jgi:predicted RNA-binding protein associated with RNAse of E/G family
VTEVHPPKIELFDVAGMTNTDPKGFVRAVHRYRRTDFGLYMARPLDGHPNIGYFRSWLLPEHGLRVGRWRAHPGQRLDHDVYIDVVDIEVDGDLWRTVDLYLDVLVRDRTDLRVLDTDEVLAARSAGLIDDRTAQRSLERTFAAVEGIAAAGYQVESWLALPLTWEDPAEASQSIE